MLREQHMDGSGVSQRGGCTETRAMLINFHLINAGSYS